MLLPCVTRLTIVHLPRSNCRCLEGFEGNAYTGCTAIGCRVDSECPERKACYDGDCLDPCIRESPCKYICSSCLDH